MAIVISGVNNNDKITASDGTIDLLSGVNYAGIITAPAFTTPGNLTAGHLNIGSGIQLGNAGIITATTLVGNVQGNINHTSNLLLQISGSEKFRVGTSGQLGIGGANYGTSGQVLTSQGSGSAVQWASASLPTLPHAFVFMDSQYFTNTTTLLAFSNPTTNDKSSGVTIDRTNERFTPTVAGVYLVHGMLLYFHGGSGAYTPSLYIFRNGSSYAYTQGIVNYSGGHYDSLNVQAMITFNGSSDYIDMRAAHNAGGNATMNGQSTLSMFRVGA